MNIMKQTAKTVGYTVGLMALFLVISVASAYAITIGELTQAQVDLDTEVDVETDLPLDTATSVDVEATTSVDSDADLKTGVDVTLDAEGELRVNRNDLPESSGAETGSLDPADVSVESDLRIFALGLLEQDEFLKEVKADEDEVSVTYAQKAELLGFIPVYVNTEVTVDADGEVDVDYPWFRFLTDIEREGLVEDIESRIALILDRDVDTDTSATSTATSTPDADIEVTWDLATRAQLIDAIYTELQETLSSEIEVEGEADTSIRA